MTKYLNKKESSEYCKSAYGLKVSAQTLSQLITRGGGPIYHKFGGRVYYTQEDLDSWIKSRISKAFHHSSEEVCHAQ